MAQNELPLSEVEREGARIAYRTGMTALQHGDHALARTWLALAAHHKVPGAVDALRRAGGAGTLSGEPRYEGFGALLTLDELLAHPSCSVPRAVLETRLRQGVEPEEAATVPHLRRKAMRYFVFGKYRSLNEIARHEDCQVSSSTLYRRVLEKGWPAEKAAVEEAEDETTGPTPVLYTLFGKRYTVAQLAARDDCAVPTHTLRKRLNANWGTLRAIRTPPLKNRASYTAFGATHTLAQLLARTDRAVGGSTLRARLRSGTWTVEEALLTPPGQPRAQYRAFGGSYTLFQLVNRGDCAVTASVLHHRLHSQTEGWTPEDAVLTPDIDTASPEHP